jgi:hypothetical protein
MYTKFSILFDTQIYTPNNISKSEMPFPEMGVFFSSVCLRVCSEDQDVISVHHNQSLAQAHNGD